MHMHTAAIDTKDRFRHKGSIDTMLGSDLFNYQAISHDLVRHSQSIGISHINFYNQLTNASVRNAHYALTGIIIVSKTNILKRHRVFYEKLIAKWAHDEQMGYVYERLWPHIFSSNCTDTEQFNCILNKSETVLYGYPP